MERKVVCFRRLNDLSYATLTQTLFKGIMFANLKAWEVWSKCRGNALVPCRMMTAI